MIEMIDLYSASFNIHSYQADSNQNAKASALFGFFMETAGWHAIRLGVGYEQLKNQFNAFWALSRFSFHISASPKWEDTITLETWPIGYNRLFAQRQFCFKNQQNEVIAYGSTDWVVMRFDTRIMIPPHEIVGHLKYDNSSLKLDTTTIKIPAIDKEKAHLTTRKALYTDLDMNQHVNSLKYLDWALDCLDSSYQQNHLLEHIDINFQHEVAANAEVDIYHQSQIPNVFIFNGNLKTLNRQAFAIQLIFK